MEHVSLPPTIDARDSEDALRAALIACLTRLPLFKPVDAVAAAERRLWRACELCSFLEYRLDNAPDPRSLSDQAMSDWARRGLGRGERIGDPTDLLDYLPYWVIVDGRLLGTVALSIRDPGWGQPNLWIASLYLFRDARGTGHGARVTAALEGVARRLGLGGLRLETDWLWQRAVRFYLRQGFWVANWKHGLSLVRYFDDPPYRLHIEQARIAFLLGDAANDNALITARRQGDALVWEEQALAEPASEGHKEPRAWVAPTFALWLAVSGWPLIRGPADWERRHHWSDLGMPEGLAYKITVFEGYARHRGFRVDTPRIPGLDYPSWEELTSPSGSG
jgi:GNAT superfamily N-acetyltransferase